MHLVIKTCLASITDSHLLHSCGTCNTLPRLTRSLSETCEVSHYLGYRLVDRGISFLSPSSHYQQSQNWGKKYPWQLLCCHRGTYLHKNQVGLQHSPSVLRQTELGKEKHPKELCPRTTGGPWEFGECPEQAQGRKKASILHGHWPQAGGLLHFVEQSQVYGSPSLKPVMYSPCSFWCRQPQQQYTINYRLFCSQKGEGTLHMKSQVNKTVIHANEGNLKWLTPFSLMEGTKVPLCSMLLPLFLYAPLCSTYSSVLHS